MEIPDKEQKELLDAVVSFLYSFELVFNIDWQLTQAIIANPKYYIEGTFIHPKAGSADRRICGPRLFRSQHGHRAVFYGGVQTAASLPFPRARI
jgi:hypothetical protein